MAFSPFNLLGTTVVSDPTRGPLGDLYSNQQSTNLLKYPIDLGDKADRGHYMVFYIKKQPVGVNNQKVSGVSTDIMSSTDFVSNRGSMSPTQTISSAATSIVTQLFSAVFGNSSATAGQVFQNNSASTSKLIQSSLKNKQGASAFLDSTRKTIMTKDTIALYMPDTLMYSYNQSYETLSPGKSALGQVGASITDLVSEKGDNAIKNFAASAGALGAIGIQNLLSGKNASGSLNNDATKLAIYKAIGGIVNPMLEVIYSAPSFRQFRFDFSFFPRSRTEALMVQNIIERLRFHQAPDTYTTSGAPILIPPSEFDIRFYYAGKINPNIDSIGNCVLKTIDVNYSPNGFQAYEIPGDDSPRWGGTGMPVEIQLSLSFEETVILTKSDFESGFAGSPTQTAPSTPSQAGVGQGLNTPNAQFNTTSGDAAAGKTP